MGALALRLVGVLRRLEIPVEFRLSSPEDSGIISAYGYDSFVIHVSMLGHYGESAAE